MEDGHISDDSGIQVKLKEKFESNSCCKDFLVLVKNFVVGRRFGDLRSSVITEKEINLAHLLIRKNSGVTMMDFLNKKCIFSSIINST